MNPDYDFYINYNAGLAQVKLEAKLDWKKVGEAFLRLSSFEQAEFLKGMLDEAAYIDQGGAGTYQMQALYIRDELAENERIPIIGMLTVLTNQLRFEGEDS